MRAIIPVAGVGSRLKPHTHTIPKVLLNVGGKPMLGHILDKLIAAGIDKATFIYGYLGEMVMKYVQNNYPSLKADFVEQVTPEGLGHAIYLATPTFDDDELFIILGDTVFDVNLEEVFSRKCTSLGVKYVDDPSRFGVALLKPDNKIDKLIEKPKEPVSNLALVGLYYIKNPALLSDCLNSLVKEDIRTRGEYQLTDALQMMIDKGEPMTVFSVEGWYDCGKPETLLATNQYLLTTGNNHYNIPGVVIVPPVFIAKTAVVTNCVIGPFTTIGENVKLADSIIRNSIIGDNAEIEKTMLENSIIGNNSVIRGAFKRLNSGDSTEIEFY